MTTLQAVKSSSKTMTASQARKVAKSTQKILWVELSTAEITKLIKGGCNGWHIEGEDAETVVSVWGEGWRIAASVAI